MNVDLDQLLKVANLLLAVGAILFTLYATRRKDVDVRFKAGSDRMDGHNLRLQALETTIQMMPDKDDQHRLQLTMTEMAGDMKAMRATMRGLADSQSRLEGIVGRHEDYMRDQP